MDTREQRLEADRRTVMGVIYPKHREVESGAKNAEKALARIFDTALAGLGWKRKHYDYMNDTQFIVEAADKFKREYYGAQGDMDYPDVVDAYWRLFRLLPSEVVYPKDAFEPRVERLTMEELQKRFPATPEDAFTQRDERFYFPPGIPTQSTGGVDDIVVLPEMAAKRYWDSVDGATDFDVEKAKDAMKDLMSVFPRKGEGMTDEGKDFDKSAAEAIDEMLAADAKILPFGTPVMLRDQSMQNSYYPAFYVGRVKVMRKGKVSEVHLANTQRNDYTPDYRVSHDIIQVVE